MPRLTTNTNQPPTTTHIDVPWSLLITIFAGPTLLDTAINILWSFTRNTFGWGA